MIKQRTETQWTANRTCAFILGVVFALLGIIGFFTPTENSTGVRAIFNTFDVDTIHSIFFLLTGLLGIAAAFVGRSRLFNQVFGVVYTVIGLLALLPFLYTPRSEYGTDGATFLGLTHMNAGDIILSIVTGVIALLIGFFVARTKLHSKPILREHV